MANEPEQPVQESQGVPRQQPQVPWDVLFPRKSAYRDAIVERALPRLLPLLKDPANTLKPPRDLVNAALDQCSKRRSRFLGTLGYLH